MDTRSFMGVIMLLAIVVGGVLLANWIQARIQTVP